MSCTTEHQALYTLFGAACKSIMGGKRFLTNKEFEENRGKFAIISGALHNVERSLKKVEK